MWINTTFPQISPSYHEAEVQISCSICPKISQESILVRKASRDKGDIAQIVPVERSRHSRGRGVPRPYTSAAKHTAKDKCIGTDGISKGKSGLIIYQRYGKEDCIQKQGVLEQISMYDTRTLLRVASKKSKARGKD